MEIKKLNILKILIAAFAIVCLSGQAAFADAPVANDDTAAVAEDSGVIAIDVLANDTDADGDALTISGVTQGSNGSVTTDGTDVSYTPAANYFGADSFTYTISDGKGGTDTGTVNVTVTSVNDNPVANNDTASMAEDSVAGAIDVLANDTDADGDALTISGVTQGSNGSVTTDGTDVSYTPAANYFGADSFTYTISDGKGGTDTGTVNVTVTSVNDNPVANNDTASMAEDSVAGAIDVLANDTDADGDALTISGVTQGSNGSVTTDGTDVSYTPDANYFGVDSFTYTIDDGNGGTDTGTVNVTVTSVNDNPVANNDTASMAEDSVAGAIDVLANDTDADGDALTISGVTQGSNGSVTTDGTDVSYTPDANYFGVDSFTYTIDDGNGGTDTGTVSVTVTNVNDIPDAVDDTEIMDEDSGAKVIDVLANDTDADPIDTLSVISVTQGSNGSVMNNGTNVTYTPNANYFGSDSFTYTISDGKGGTDTATVNLTVTSVNDNPDALDDGVTVVEDSGATVINVLSNDTDTEGDALTITGITPASNGIVTNNGTNVSYTPDADYFGGDSFTYTIDDGNGGIDTGTVSVTVTNVNDIPDAVDDTEVMDEDSGAKVIDVLVNDTDADPIDTLSVISVTQGSNGSVTNNGTNVTYTPNANYFGSDSFTYTISDGKGGTDTATVNVTVTSVNDNPDAVDDTATVVEDSGATVINVLSNDTDTEGDALTITGVTPASNGIVTTDGTDVSYTPAANYFGSDSFTYTIDDGNGGTDTATVSVTVTNVNDIPDAVDDTEIMDEDSGAKVIDVLANDTDADPIDTLSVISVTQGTNGSVTNNGTNVTYTPNANYFGSDSFTYTIDDGNGSTDTATVNVTVTSVNDVPVADFSGTPLIIVEGEWVNFTDLSTDIENTIVGWSWDFGDGSAPDTAQNTTHLYSIPGTYTVSLTVTDADGATDTEIKTGYIWVKALYDLTITWTGTGSGDVTAGAGAPSGYLGGSSNGAAGHSVHYIYVEGDTVALSALATPPPPGLGSIFKGFSGDAAGMAPTMTMDGDKSVTAEFAQTWEIFASASAIAGANGTISPSGSVQVEEGSGQTFTIDPDTCYEIFGVSVDGSSLDPLVTEYTFTNVTENHTIDAAFIEYDCIITATAEYGGTMLPVGTMIVSCGSSQTFTITPAAGNAVEDVLVDGVSVGAVTSHTFTNIEKDDPDGFGACSHSIVAKFTRLPVACMEISDIPLTTLINSAPANIMFVMDDSGSMDFEVMTTEDDGLFHTKTATVEYLFDIVDNMYHVGVNSQVLSGDDRKLWKSQWVGINKVYYDPTVYYEPWISLTDAPLDNPWSQPMYNNAGDPFLNLSGTYVSIDAGIVVDNLDGAPYFTTTGTWSESDIAPEHDGSSVQTTSSGDTATFTPNIPTPGDYDVYAWWNCYNDRDENAEITIVDSVGNHTVNMDQRSGGADGCGEWVLLDTYNFAAGTSGSVTIGRHALSTGSSTVADAVKFVKSGISIDIKNAHYYIWSASLGKPYLVVVDGGNINYYAVNDSDSDDMIEDGELTIIGSPPDDVIPKNESGTPRTYLEERQNFANWFSYYRRRDLVTRMAIGKVLTEMSGVNIGFRGINGVLKQPVLKVKVEGEDNTSDLLNALYSYRLDADRASTPLRRGMEYVGQYFDQDDGEDGGVGTSPIASAEDGGECQQNFAVVFTDGYYNGLAPVKVGNEDGDNGPPYADSQPGTLADTAMMYYENDLADSLDNKVPANQFDDATYQHLVFYGITFGVHGTLNPDDYDVENCIDGTEADCPPWPEPINEPIKKIDDLWHAAVNGRGLFLSASNPQELIAAFLAVMENIILRIGSASSVSVNGDELYTKLSGNILMYQSNYDSDGWVGDVKAYQVCTDLTGVCEGKEVGDVITSTYAWSANEKLESLDWDLGRNIVTYNGTDAGKPFRWGDDLTGLTATQKASLNNDSTLLDYLRGDTSNEKANGGTFRDRFARLGDIVHSSPVFENGVLYAGGNDGMLHAFAAADGEPYEDAVGGEELFAYVPNLIFNNLSQLADPAYAHKYFVDLTPTVQSGVDISGNTTTVLVGGLGHGGKGYYALDVTDPESWTSEGAIDGKVMWEYPKAGVTDNDMGYSYSKPVIVKSMDSSVGSNGWIVIFGNGYNSQNGHAVLYILNPGTGAIIKKIDTGVDGCNGLSSPVPIDVDYDDMVDYVYAGDLRGNVWKFDLTDTDYTNWEVAFYDGGEKPLFQAQGPGGTTQPITTKPDVMYHPKEHGYMVVFGTGQFLGEPDFFSTTVQSFYGIWDYGDDEDDGEYLGSFNRGFGHELSNQESTVTLLGQQVIPSESPDPNAPDFWTVTLTDGAGNPYDLPLRLTTNNEIVWETMDDPDGNQYMPDLSNAHDNHAGWYFDLPLSGEKGTVDVMLRNGNAIAISYRPDDVPCSAGGNSVIHEFSAESGARLTRPQFDINGDGVVDENDMINIGTDENPIWVVPTGIQLPGQIQPPAILIDPETGLEIKYLSSSSGTIEKVKEKAALVGITHWREFE